jgi:hypothetical protein
MITTQAHRGEKGERRGRERRGRSLNVNRKCHKQIFKLKDVVVGNGILMPKCLSLNYIRNNIVVCNGGATDLDAIKNRYGIHSFRIREHDLWVCDTVNASLGLHYIVPGGDKSPAFICLPRVDSIQIMKSGRGICNAMRTCALTQRQPLSRGNLTVYSQRMVMSIAV